MENQRVYGQNMLISETFIATAWKGVRIKHIHTFPAALAAAHWGEREYRSKIEDEPGESWRRREIVSGQKKLQFFWLFLALFWHFVSANMRIWRLTWARI